MNNYPDGSPLGETFSAILNRNEVDPVTDPDETRELVQKVVNRDSAATLRLLTAVGGMVRKLRANFRRVPRMEFDSAVSLALFEVVKEYDFSAPTQTTATVGTLLYHRTMEALAPDLAGLVPVPRRTVQRFFAIERAAKKEADELGVLDHRFIALRIAKDYHMDPNCYMDVRNALAACNETQLSAELAGTDLTAERVMQAAADRFVPDSVAESDDELVARAFEAVDDLEAAVCYVAYGFGKECHPEADDNARSDAEVGERLGLSNSKAYRTRHKALGKMHDALMPDA